MSDIQVKVGNGVGTIPSDSPAVTGIAPTNPSPIQPLNSQSSAITQKTNDLLGGTYFDPATGAQVKQYDPNIAKSVLENAANAGGSALSGGTPVPTRTAPSVTTPDGTPLTDFNFQAEYEKANGAAPAVPNFDTEQANAETKAGIPDIQNNINTLTGQLTNLQNDLQNRQAQEASKPGVVATIINGRMRMLSAEDSKALNDLKAQINSSKNQLTQANTAVATLMKNKQQSYTDSANAYKEEYTKAYQAFTAGENRLTKEQTAASANAKVIIDSYKGTANASKITALDEAQWHTMEMQAGLPQGFIKAAIQAESTAGVKVDHWSTDASGNTYAYGTDASGKPVILQTFNATGKPSAPKKGTTPTKPKTTVKQDADEVEGFIKNRIQSVKRSDSYLSPEEYKDFKASWVKDGRSSATFDSIFGKYRNPNDKTLNNNGSETSNYK